MSKNKITIFNVASTIILQGLAFFSGPIISSLLGTRNYGIASVYLTWVQMASTVFSLQAGGTLAVARVNYPEEEQLMYQSSVLSLASITYAFFSAVTVIICCIFSKQLNVPIPMLLLGLSHGWGLYCVSFMNSKFTYEFKAEKNFVLSVLVAALTMGLSIFLIRLFPSNINYYGRIFAQSLVYTSIGAFLSIYIIKRGKTIYNKKYWKFTLPIALPTIFHTLANIALNQSDKVMLQWLLGSSSAGIYSLACTFGAVLNTIWSALNNSWVPFYYEYTKLGQIEQMKKHAKNYIELFTIITMGFILLAKEVFHIYADQSFWNGTDLIPLFSIGYYFVFLYSFPVNYEFYNKKTKSIAAGTMFAALCNICLNIILILFFDIKGAVIATALSHGLQFGFHYFSAKKIKRCDFPFALNDFLPGIISVCLTSIFYWATKDYWIIRWSLGAFLGVYLLIKVVRRKEIF